MFQSKTLFNVLGLAGMFVWMAFRSPSPAVTWGWTFLPLYWLVIGLGPIAREPDERWPFEAARFAIYAVIGTAIFLALLAGLDVLSGKWTLAIFGLEIVCAMWIGSATTAARFRFGGRSDSPIAPNA